MIDHMDLYASIFQNQGNIKAVNQLAEDTARISESHAETQIVRAIQLEMKGQHEDSLAVIAKVGVANQGN